MATDSIDFIDEDNARRMLLRLFEHIAHARSADADEHFDEVRTRDREERNLRFTRDRACKQRLTGTRRTDHQYAARNFAAQALKLTRILQEFDDLDDFFLRF